MSPFGTQIQGFKVDIYAGTYNTGDTLPNTPTVPEVTGEGAAPWVTVGSLPDGNYTAISYVYHDGIRAGGDSPEHFTILHQSFTQTPTFTFDQHGSILILTGDSVDTIEYSPDGSDWYPIPGGSSNFIVALDVSGYLRGFGGGGKGYSAAVGFTGQTLSAPTGLTATPTGPGSVHLSWDAIPPLDSSDPAVPDQISRDIQVERSDDGGAHFHHVTHVDASATGMDDTYGLTNPAYTYIYRIRLEGPAGSSNNIALTGYSPYSATATAKTWSAYPADFTKIIGPTEIDLNWSDMNEGETETDFRVSTDFTFQSDLHAVSVSPDVTHIALTGLAPGSFYYIQARCLPNGTSDSTWSWIGFANTEPLPTVSVSAKEDAFIAGPDAKPGVGYFELSRTGNTDVPLTVHYTVDTSASDAATPGEEYQPLSGTAVIPAQCSNVLVEIDPKDPDNVVGTTTVTEDVTASDDYQAAAPAATENVVPPRQLLSLSVLDTDSGNKGLSYSGTHDLYVVEGPDGTASIDCWGEMADAVTAPAEAFNAKLIRYSVDGSTATPASGILTQDTAPTESRIKLAPEDDDHRDFTVTGWYDANGNGIQDKDETSCDVTVVVVKIEMKIRYIDKDNPTNTTWSNWSSTATVYAGSGPGTTDAVQVTIDVYGIPVPTQHMVTYYLTSTGAGVVAVSSGPVAGSDPSDDATISPEFPGTLDGNVKIRMPNNQVISQTNSLGMIGVRTDDVAVVGYFTSPTISTAPDPTNPTLFPAGIDTNLKTFMAAPGGVQSSVLSMFKPNLGWGGTASDLGRILSGNYPTSSFSRFVSAWSTLTDNDRGYLLTWIRDVDAYSPPVRMTPTTSPSAPGYLFLLDSQIKGLVKTTASGSLVWSNIKIINGVFKNGGWWRPTGTWALGISGPSATASPALSKSGEAVYSMADSAPDPGILSFIDMLAPEIAGTGVFGLPTQQKTYLGDIGAQISFDAGATSPTITLGTSIYYQVYQNGSWPIGPKPAHSSNDNFDFTTTPYPGTPGAFLKWAANTAAGAGGTPVPFPGPLSKVPNWGIPPK